MKKRPSDFKFLDPLELATFKASRNWCHSTERVMFDLLHSLPDVGSKRISIENKHRTAMFVLDAVREALDDNDPRANPKGKRFGTASVGASNTDEEIDETLH